MVKIQPQLIKFDYTSLYSLSLPIPSLTDYIIQEA